MRALLPEPAESIDVHAHYARDWVEPGGLRVNFVSSVDGGAQASGLSQGLQTPGDNIVFSALRDLADVVVAGAGTVTAEGYRPARVSDRRRAIRGEYGLASTLPIAVISRTLRLDPDVPLFADAPPDARTIVLTCAAADASRRRALAAVADVVVCGEDAVDSQQARAALEERGHRRILSEGGPSVFADLARDGVVDELCLSMSPLLVGPGPGRITAGVQWSAATELDLMGLLTEDGALFARYAVRRR